MQENFGPWESNHDQTQQRLSFLKENQKQQIKLPLLRIKTNKPTLLKSFEGNVYVRSVLPKTHKNKQSYYSLNENLSLRSNFKFDTSPQDQEQKSQSCQTNDLELPKISGPSSGSRIFVYSKEYEESLLVRQFSLKKEMGKRTKPYLNFNSQVLSALKRIQSKNNINQKQRN